MVHERRKLNTSNIKPDIKLSEVFTPGKVAKTLIYVAVHLSVFVVICVFLCLLTFGGIYKAISDKIAAYGYGGQYASMEICRILSCKYIYQPVDNEGNWIIASLLDGKGDHSNMKHIMHNGKLTHKGYKVYESTETQTLYGGFKQVGYIDFVDDIELFFNLDHNLDVIFYYGESTIIIGKNHVLQSFAIVIVPFLIVGGLIYILLYFLWNVRQHKTKSIEKGEFKQELEAQLQRDISEMIHHELRAPVEVITAELDELLYKLYPAYHNTTEHTDLETWISNDEQHTHNLNEEDKEILRMFDRANMGLIRIKTILNIVAGTKHIRFSNGTVPIKQIIDNIYNSVNAFKLNKMDMKYCDCDDKITKYSVHHKYGNGNFLNAIHVLFNNAIEAHSSQVDIWSKMISNDGEIERMEIFVKDYGSGILDQRGKPVADDRIFQYGWTGKDIAEYITWKDRILNLLGYNTTKQTRRGIGLFLTRKILRDAGGDIELFETGYGGTTFKLTLPVKKTDLAHCQLPTY